MSADAGGPAPGAAATEQPDDPCVESAVAPPASPDGKQNPSSQVKSLAQLLAAPQSVTHTPGPPVEPVVEAHIPEMQALPVSHAMPSAKVPGAAAPVPGLESSPPLEAAPESAPEDEDWPEPASTSTAQEGTA